MSLLERRKGGCITWALFSLGSALATGSIAHAQTSVAYPQTSVAYPQASITFPQPSVAQTRSNVDRAAPGTRLVDPAPSNRALTPTPIVASDSRSSADDPNATIAARWNNPNLTRALSLGAVGGIYVAMNLVAYFSWWFKSPPEQFVWSHDGWFASNTYGGGSDKIGHFYMNAFLTRANAGLLEEGGWHPRTSTYAGAMMAFGTYFVFEMRDAYSTGFSKNDTIANAVGVATGALMREVPIIDELFDFRVQYFPSDAYVRNFKKKGINFNEDYTGLTFLFAWHLCSVPFVEKHAGILRFADVVLGYNTRNYRPKVQDPTVTRYQDRFIGVSLNLQRIIDELWLGKRHPRFGESAGPVHRFMHFGAEFFSLPFTSLPLGTWTNEYHKQPPRDQ